MSTTPSTRTAPHLGLQHVRPYEANATTLGVTFSDGSHAEYNLFWLRDHCPSGFHPQTQERTFDLLSLPETLHLAAAHLNAQGALELRWAHDGHVSTYTPAWLWERRPGLARHDPAAIAPIVWRAQDLGHGPRRFDAAALLHSDSALKDWLIYTKQYGLSLVEGIAASDAGGNTHNGGHQSIALAKRIGFLRETNFGLTFEVVNKPDPNNLAYTAVELPLHTDLPNQELPPGFQFLHCLTNEAQGGGSVFADGFALAQALAASDPEAYETLCTVRVPFRFFDREADIRVRRPIITRDAEGALQEIAYNAHLADLLGLSNAELARWYPAYRQYMRLTRDTAFRVSFKLNAGEMILFDNRRVLHGRESFDPTSGARHLHGCYVDRVEFDSRLRMLG